MKRLLPLLAATLTLLAPCAHAAATLELIEAGAAPRETIRYRFKSGASERAAVESTVNVALSLGGQQIPMQSSPSIRMGMNIRTAEVDADGSARIEFDIASAEVVGDAPQAAQMNQMLGAVKGMSGSYRLDPRGQIAAGSINAPAGAPGADLLASLDDTMQQMAAAFPAEAVGRGARWRVIQNVDMNGMKISQTIEYTLRERSGNRVALDLKITDSTMDIGAAMPPGARVDSMKMEGGGTTTIDLTSLVPTMTMNLDMAASMSISAQGQTQAMTMFMQTRQSMGPAAVSVP